MADTSTYERGLERGVARTAEDSPVPFLEVWRCSVVVIQLINYAEVALEVPAREFALWLHGLYCRLDAVTQKHQAHKVSTAQELYVTVIQEQDGENTAEAAVALANELLAVVQELTVPSGGPLICRIAVSSGQAAAAVTGTAAWSFQLYGMTLEKAKAVVQAGPVGVLQLTGDVVHHLPHPHAFHRHRTHPEFAGLVVYTQATAALADTPVPDAAHLLPTPPALILLHAALAAAATHTRRFRAALGAFPLQFQDHSLERKFQQAWNTKLYQQDLWVLAILTPVSLVSCLALSIGGELSVSQLLASSYLWLSMALTALMAALWATRPATYIRHRRTLVTLYCALRIALYTALQASAGGPRCPAPGGWPTLLPRGILVFMALSVAVQVQFGYQLLLHLLAYAATMLEFAGACRQHAACRAPHQCSPPLAVVAAWLNFTAVVAAPLAFCWMTEKAARIAFIHASNSQDGGSARRLCAAGDRPAGAAAGKAHAKTV